MEKLMTSNSVSLSNEESCDVSSKILGNSCSSSLSSSSSAKSSKKVRKIDVLFENYGLEFIPANINEDEEGRKDKDNSPSSSSSSKRFIAEEGQGEQSEEGEDEREIDSKQLFRIALVNYRLTITDGKPLAIPFHSSSPCDGSEDFLYIGSIGSAYNLDQLLSTGITHILNLSEVIKCRFPSYFIYKKIHLTDKSTFNLLPHLQDCFTFINEVRQVKNGKVLIHCYQGISRSTAVLAAYMITHGNYTREQALSLIKSIRPKIAPNQGFMEVLKQLEEEESLNRKFKEQQLITDGTSGSGSGDWCRSNNQQQQQQRCLTLKGRDSDSSDETNISNRLSEEITDTEEEDS